ncbi:MAG: NAD-dependent succinate-semialdehyde dehydrogenase [Limisphaerales bacterium]
MSTETHRGITSINPATGQVLRRYDADTKDQVEQKLHRAWETFLSWRETPFAERSRLLRRAAEVLDNSTSEFAHTVTSEMGKSVRSAAQEIEKCARACRYYAEHAERFLADEQGPEPAGRSFVRYQPLGPVLAIMPWNFPFWQVFRFAAPALMAGNVGLLKHASNVPGSALAIQEVFDRAGFPGGAFQTLLIGSDRVGELIGDSRVRAVTLTGSVEAGRKVAAAAGGQIKKTVLELGGSDPFIVMPSADLDRAASTAVQARTVNNGQSCIAAKRFIVDRRIAAEFEQLLVARMSALKIGDPMEEDTAIGPLATMDVLEALEKQVNRTVELGARVLCGGERLERPGYFYPPTVLNNIASDSPAYREELFGPVASVFQVDGAEEAVRLANDTEFGLGSSAWTNDARERELFIQELEAGMVFINGMVASDPRLPFGGVKQSGYGRELSYQGIREFVNIKTVVIDQAERPGTE